MEYTSIVVESFKPSDTSGRHGKIHIRPIPGQDPFSPNLFVECSKVLSTDYPVGTKFRILAKITSRKEGAKFIYSNYKWPFEVVNQ